MKGVFLNLSHLKEHRTLLVVYFILVLLVAGSSAVSDTFLKPNNISNVLRQAVAIGLVSIGQTFVIITAGIDLSVGSVISLTSCLAAGFMRGRDAMIIPVVALVIALALIIGFCNGFIIVKMGITPLIVTLGTMSIIQGAVLVYTDAAYGEVAPAFFFLSWGEIGWIPFPVLLLAALGAAGVFVLRRTPFGRYIYAVGGNEETARLSGVKAGKVKVYTYMTCSFMAALTGLFLTSRMGMGDPLIGVPYMLDSLVPVLIGGTLLSGGKGSLIGTFAGIFILTVLSNSLNLLEVSGYWQWVVEGTIILVAVAFYEKRRA
jgi:ribose transport system permease protein